jgi:hypothetical protein
MVDQLKPERECEGIHVQKRLRSESVKRGNVLRRFREIEYSTSSDLTKLKARGASNVGDKSNIT